MEYTAIGSTSIGTIGTNIYPTGDYPWWQYPIPSPTYIQPTVTYGSIYLPQSECSGDIHVFPCPHCNKCKCGKAIKTEGP